MDLLSPRFPGIRRTRSDDLPGIVATVRLDHQTKRLIRRLEPGDIAIIDHADLDRVSAEALIRRRVAAVVNATASMSGRYPNPGPQLLVAAGIPLIDDVGPDIFDSVRERQRVRLDGGILYRGQTILAKGTVQTAGSLAAELSRAKAGLADQIRGFMANTVEYIHRESELLIDGIALPGLATRLAGRHVLVVARGYRYQEDLQALRAYIREFKPVKIAVDGGADALLEAGYRPDMIVGDMDSVSDMALRCGAEVVVHAYLDGRAPGLRRVEELGVDCLSCPASGTSEDVAVLLADEAGAALIVTVGMRFSLAEFLDKGRPGMASAVLTRIRVGDKIVDAKGVSRLYHSRISSWSLVLLALAAAVTIAVTMTSLAGGQDYLKYLGSELAYLRHWLAGLF